MAEQKTFKIKLNSIEKDIPQLALRKQGLSDAIFNAIFDDPKHEYHVKSDVSEELLTSFIKYWVNDEIPNIDINNIREYIELSEEFGLMKEIINERRNLMTDCERIIDCLNNPSINDKSLYEEVVSKDLDNYLIKYGPTLMNQPIQTLINIFSNKECQFTEHNIAYKLIKEQFEKSNDSNIFVLLSFIDGKQLSHEYLKESIEERSNRNNFIPHLDFSYISEIQDELNKAKDIQKQQQATIEGLQNYISNLEERLKSIETRFEEQNGRIEEKNLSIETALNDMQNRINSLDNDNEVNKNKITEVEEKTKTDLIKIEDNFKHSAESSFCHYLFDCMSNNISFDEIVLPNFEGLYIYRPVTKDGPGILSYLKESAQNEFDRQFIVRLSHRDPYDLLLDNWDGRLFSLNTGNFYIEITLENSIEITGFELRGYRKDLAKSYQIFIDDEMFLDIQEDTQMRDEHKTLRRFDAKSCRKFKFVQTGPNWDREEESKKKSISLTKIEFFTTDYPEGLFKHWNEDKDPHSFPLKIDSNHLSTENIHLLNSHSVISVGNIGDRFCQIDFLNGVVLVEGYRIKRRFPQYKMKKWKIVGTPISSEEEDEEEVIISEFEDSSVDSDPLYISTPDVINKHYIKSLKIKPIGENWDSTNFFSFNHFEIFGQFIAD